MLWVQIRSVSAEVLLISTKNVWFYCLFCFREIKKKISKAMQVISFSPYNMGNEEGLVIQHIKTD